MGICAEQVTWKRFLQSFVWQISPYLFKQPLRLAQIHCILPVFNVQAHAINKATFVCQ